MSEKAKKTKKPSSGLAAAGFISFSEVLGEESAGSPAASASLSMTSLGIYQGSHAELAMHCKKVSKKDLVTKLKALVEINAIIISDAPSDTSLIPGFMPFFSFMFTKIALENEWSVREKFGVLLNSIVGADRPALRPFLGEVMGPWYLLMSDPVSEVRERYLAAFPVKRRQATISYLSPIDDYLCRHADIHLATLKEQFPSASPEELEEKKDRLVQSSLTAIGELITTIRDGEEEQGSIASLRCVREVMAESILVKHAGHVHWPIRNAVIDLLQSLPHAVLHENIKGVTTVLTTSLDRSVDSHAGIDRMLAAWGDLARRLGPVFWTSNLFSVPATLRKIFALRSMHSESLSSHLLSFLSTLPLPYSSLFVDQLATEATPGADKVFRVIVNQMTEWLASHQAEPSSAALVRRCRSLTALLEGALYLLLRKPQTPSSSSSSSSSSYILDENRRQMVEPLLLAILRASLLLCLEKYPQTAWQELRTGLCRGLRLLDRSQWVTTNIDALKAMLDEILLQACPRMEQTACIKAKEEVRIVSALLEIIQDSFQGKEQESGSMGLQSLFLHLLQPYRAFPATTAALYSTISVYQWALEVVPMTTTSLRADIRKQSFALIDDIGSWLPLLLSSLDNAIDSADAVGDFSSQDLLYLLTTAMRFLYSPVTDDQIPLDFMERGHAALSARLLDVGLTTSSSALGLTVWLQLLAASSLPRCSPALYLAPVSQVQTLMTHALTGEDGISMTIALHFLAAAHLYLATSVRHALLTSEQAFGKVAQQIICEWTAAVAVLGPPVYYLAGLVATSLRRGVVDGEEISMLSSAIGSGETINSTHLLAVLPDLYFATAHSVSRSSDIRKAPGHALEGIFREYLPRLVGDKATSIAVMVSWEEVEKEVVACLPLPQRSAIVHQLCDRLNHLLSVGAEGWSPAHYGLHVGYLIAKNYWEVPLKLCSSASEDCIHILNAHWWAEKKSSNLPPSQQVYVMRCLEAVLLHSGNTTVDCLCVPSTNDVRSHLLFAVWQYCADYLFESNEHQCRDDICEVAASLYVATHHALAASVSRQPFHRRRWLHGVLQWLSGADRPSARRLGSDALFTLTEPLHTPSSAKYDEIGALRSTVQFTTALPRLTLGQAHVSPSLYYLSITPALDTQLPMRHYRLLPIKEVCGVHLGDGLARPYYSLRFGDDGEREIQTEWCRVFVAPSLQLVTAVDTVVEPLEELSRITEAACLLPSSPPMEAMLEDTSLAHPAQLRAMLWPWMQQSVRHLLRSMAHSSVFSKEEEMGTAQRANFLAPLLPLVFSADSRAADQVNELQDEEVRGCAVDLRSVLLYHLTRSSSVSLIVDEAMTELLASALQCSEIVGSGLWLAPALAAIQTRLMPVGSPSNNEEVLSSTTVRQLAALLTNLEWNSAMDVAVRAVFSMPSQLLQLPLVARVQLYTAYWRRRAAFYARTPTASSANPAVVEGVTEDSQDPAYRFDVFEHDLSWEPVLYRDLILQFVAVARQLMQLQDIVVAEQLPSPPRNLWLGIAAAVEAAIVGPPRPIEALLKALFSDESAMPLLSALEKIVHADVVPATSDQVGWTKLCSEELGKDLQVFAETVRLAAARVVDAAAALSASARASQAIELLTLGDSSTEEEDGLDAEIDAAAAEAKEAARDEEVFRSVLGSSLAAHLINYFPVTLLAITGQSIGRHSAISDPGSLETNIEGPEEGAEEEFMGNEVSLAEERGLSERQRGSRVRAYCQRWQHMGGIQRALYAWLLSLRALDSCASAASVAAGPSAPSEHDHSAGTMGGEVQSACAAHLRRSGLGVRALHCLRSIIGQQLVSRTPTPLPSSCTSAAIAGCGGYLPPPPISSLHLLAQVALARTVAVLPSLFRAFYTDHCLASDKTGLSAFVEQKARFWVVQREVVDQVSAYDRAGRLGAEKEVFSVTGRRAAGEVHCVYHYDETEVVLVLRLPPSYPLRSVEVDCSARFDSGSGTGTSGTLDGGRQRRWSLQILQALARDDQSVVDAAVRWRQSFEAELRGCEPCPICYATLHHKTMKPPTFRCPTCNNKFHPGCLLTWHRSSGKNTCPLCQQPLLR